MIGIAKTVRRLRWQFGIAQMIYAATFTALALATYRFFFAEGGSFRLWEFLAAMMFATGCIFAAVGVMFGRVSAVVGFIAGAAVGAWAFWRMVTTGL